MIKSLFSAVGLAAVACLLTPSPSFAQPYPGGYNQPPPGYAIPNRDERGRHELTGRVTEFQPYNLWLDRNLHVVLHRGTVINPTGIRLRRGMRVAVFGYYNRDGSFEANQIDVERGVRY